MCCKPCIFHGFFWCQQRWSWRSWAVRVKASTICAWTYIWVLNLYFFPRLFEVEGIWGVNKASFEATSFGVEDQGTTCDSRLMFTLDYWSFEFLPGIVSCEGDFGCGLVLAYQVSVAHGLGGKFPLLLFMLANLNLMCSSVHLAFILHIRDCNWVLMFQVSSSYFSKRGYRMWDDVLVPRFSHSWFGR